MKGFLGVSYHAFFNFCSRVIKNMLTILIFPLFGWIIVCDIIYKKSARWVLVALYSWCISFYAFLVFISETILLPQRKILIPFIIAVLVNQWIWLVYKWVWHVQKSHLSKKLKNTLSCYSWWQGNCFLGNFLMLFRFCWSVSESA